MSTTITLPTARFRFGAPLGRENITPAPGQPVPKAHLVKLRINSGGYDQDGTYWGARPLGTAIWNCYSKDRLLDIFVDADNRAQAIEKVMGIVPGIKFIRH